MESTTQTPFKLTHQIVKIPMGDSVTAFKCQLTVEGNFSTSIQKHIIVALDNSGSMGGSAMKFSKEGVKELLTYLNQRGNKRVSLISYNSTSKIEFLPQSTAEQRQSIVDSIQAHDRTSFCDVFIKIQEVMKKEPSKEVCIVFFTDGQDTCNEPPVVNESLKTLALFIRKNSIFSETHTIGFTESHDAALLSEITTIGNNQGTFQYCKSSKDIPVCVDSVAGLVGGHTITAKVNFSDNSDPLVLELEEATAESQERKLETLFYVENNKIVNGCFDLILNVESHSVVQKIKVDELALDEEGKMGVLNLQLGLIKSEVTKLVKEATNMKFDRQVETNGIKSLISRLDMQEQALEKSVNELAKGLKTSQRKDIFPQIQEVRTLIIDFYATLRNFQKGQITNDTIASLNALAYKGITKKGLQKKLDKRTQLNVNLMNDVYSKVSEIAEKIDYNSLREKYSELSEKLGDCVLSCNSFIEALADEDCLCLTFDIGRSQAAIADATQVIIKKVFPSFLTAGSFLYSAQFALKTNDKAHGGFEKHAEGLIVKGAAQENITGVMPLYICPENWRIAKLIMKPTLGWSVTLDPLGYAYSQMKIIPFMILNKLVEMLRENPTSEFIKFQFQLVKDTCIQILKDGSKPHFETRFSEEIKTIFDKYVSDPSTRTPDIIANNSVFLSQLYCAIEAGLIEKKSNEEMEEFFKKMLEEELRRKQLNWNSSTELEDPNAGPGQIVDDIPGLLFKILNIDTQKYIEEPLKEYFLKKDNKDDLLSKADNSEYERKFLQAYALLKFEKGEEVKSEEIQKKNTEKIKDEERKTSDVFNNPHLKDFAPIKFEYSLKKNDNYNTSQKKALQEYQETLQRVTKYFYPLCCLLGISERTAEKFKSWGIDSDLKFFCLYIQNKLQGKNWARREAISSKNYKDPWSQNEEFLQFWYSKLIEEEKSKRITQYLNEIEGIKSDANSTVFLNSQNVYEAAGAFMGTFIGKNINHFYKKFGKLAKNKDPLAKEKIEMMITGHYKGVKLYNDADNWIPSRAHANMIWRANKHCMSAEDWKALIPSLSYRFVKGEAKCPPPNERLKHKNLQKLKKSNKK